MTTTPYFSPNWAKRMMRLNKPKVPKAPDLNDPQQGAMSMFQSGQRVGADGVIQPTQDFGGMLGKASQQVNSLTKGVRGGQFSSLGKPLNSMYEQNPGFFKRAPSSSFVSGGSPDAVSTFGQMLAQRGQPTPNTPTLPNDTPGAASALARKGMMSMGTTSTPTFGARTAPAVTGTAPATPSASPSSPDWYAQAAGKKLLEQAMGDAPTVSKPSIGYQIPGGGTATMDQIGNAKNIEGKYGSGFIDPTGATRRAPGQEGLINGKPFSQVMQGLANKPGIARPGDKFQAQTLTPAENKRLEEAAKKTPKR